MVLNDNGYSSVIYWMLSGIKIKASRSYTMSYSVFSRIEYMFLSFPDIVMSWTKVRYVQYICIHSSI